jgi:N-glycosylase/DNA lyase
VKRALIVDKLEPTVIRLTKVLNVNKPTVTWNELSEDDLWYELVACILGSQTKYELAQAFTKHLRNSHILDFETMKNDYYCFEKTLFEALSQKIVFSVNDLMVNQKYRYPRSKANYIRRTGERIYENSSIKDMLIEYKDPFNTRSLLISKTVGIGPKQASLFLRNIGYSDNLAILDVHVLRYMSLMNLFSYSVKNTGISSIYQQLENVLRKYAEYLNTKLSNLDLAIWIVMRIYEREYQP